MKNFRNSNLIIIFGKYAFKYYLHDEFLILKYFFLLFISKYFNINFESISLSVHMFVTFHHANIYTTPR